MSHRTQGKRASQRDWACEVARQRDARGRVDQNHTDVILGRQIEGEGA